MGKPKTPEEWFEAHFDSSLAECMDYCIEYERGVQADLARLQARVRELEDALRQTHASYCTKEYTERGRHAPECLLYVVGRPEAAP